MITSYVTLTEAPWKEILQFAITLFAILNPVAGATMYLSLVEQQERHQKLQTARKAAYSILIILLTIVWIGDVILNLFGISIAAFRVGGGFIVVLVGLSMLEFININVKPIMKHEKKDVAVVPLSIPIIAGPGVIAVTLTEMQNTFDSLREKLIISVTTVFIVFLMWLTLRFASSLAEKIGPVGVDILSKIMGLILIVIATQMILEGLIAVFPAWTVKP